MYHGWNSDSGSNNEPLPQPLITQSESYLRDARIPRRSATELREARNAESRRHKKLGSGLLNLVVIDSDSLAL